MSAVQPPEGDLDALRSEIKDAFAFLKAEREYQQSQQREKERAKVEKEMNTARELTAETEALTANLKDGFKWI